MSGTGLTLSDLAFLGQGALMTLAVTAIAVTGGTALGLLFGVVRTQVGPWWALPLTFLLDVFRSVPLLIQLVLAKRVPGHRGARPAAVRDLVHRARPLHLGLLHRDREGRHRRGAGRDAARGAQPRPDLGAGHGACGGADGAPRGAAVLDRA